MDTDFDEIFCDVEKRYRLTVDQYQNIQHKKTEQTGLLSSVFRVMTDKGVLCLKIYKEGNYDRQELLVATILPEHLFTHGYSLTPRYLTDANGDGLISIGDFAYTLSDWIDGERPQTGNQEHMKATARSLAKFHRASESYRPWKDLTQYHWTDHALWESWARELADIAILFADTHEELQRKAQKLPFEEEWLKDFPYYLTEAAEMQQRSVSLKAEYDIVMERSASKQGFVHDDLGAQNLVIAENREAYLIDVEQCAQKPRWHDICPLLTGMDILSLPNIECAQEVASEYHRHYTLTPEEAMIIPVLVSPVYSLWWFIRFAEGASDIALGDYYRRSAGNVNDRINFRKQLEAFLADLVRNELSE